MKGVATASLSVAFEAIGTALAARRCRALAACSAREDQGHSRQIKRVPFGDIGPFLEGLAGLVSSSSG
jgi:hypothetical protein